MEQEEVNNLVDFLVKHVHTRPRDLPRKEVKEALAKVEEFALKGLSSPTILTLAQKVVFTNYYDSVIRRRLLYCLIPKGEDFPLQVVPLAVSSASVKDANIAWQYAVLTWLSGMLEFGIIQASDPMIHICYTIIFNFLGSLTLSSVASRVVYHMTVRQDVTPNRVQTLLKLRQKPAFDVPASSVLRLYHLFRPDLVTGKLAEKGVMSRFPPALKARLLEARLRLQEEAGYLDFLKGKEKMWQDGAALEKVNYYQRNSAIPLPSFIPLSLTVEEKKMKPLFVTQHQRFSDLVRGIDDWESWVWPTNPAAYLACPMLVPLFRPHKVELQVGLTNWLEVTLRTELLEGIGLPSIERQNNLLITSHKLCFSHAASLSVIANFLMEHVPLWNQKDNFEQIVRLLQYIGFTSMAKVCWSVLPVLEQMFQSQPLIGWSRVVNSVIGMVCNWLFTAYQERTTNMPAESDWQQRQQEFNNILMGVWFISQRLERIFMFNILDHFCATLVYHHILDYYERVDAYCDRLELPLTVHPPPLLTMAIIHSTSDPALKHRLGHILARMKKRLETLLKMQQEGCNDATLITSIKGMAEVKYHLFMFRTVIMDGKTIPKRWRNTLKKFCPITEPTGEDINIGKSGSTAQALPFTPYNVRSILLHQAENDTLLAELSADGLTGFEECYKAFLNKRQQEEAELSEEDYEDEESEEDDEEKSEEE